MKWRSEVPGVLRAPAVRRSDVPVALAITLLVQTIVSLVAASVAVLAPAIAHGRGWNMALVALYAPLLYVAAFSISFGVPWLLSRLGGMGLAHSAWVVCSRRGPRWPSWQLS
jgi:ABC-type polysaccharide/polyol phosphate export permease